MKNLKKLSWMLLLTAALISILFTACTDAGAGTGESTPENSPETGTPEETTPTKTIYALGDKDFSYYKDGERYQLGGEGAFPGELYDLKIVDATIYVAGFSKTEPESNSDNAGYFKGSSWVPITSGGTATGIEVVGDDVYVCGTSGSNARLWKNGSAVGTDDAPDGTNYRTLSGMSRSGDYLFIGGFIQTELTVGGTKYFTPWEWDFDTDSTVNFTSNEQSSETYHESVIQAIYAAGKNASNASEIKVFAGGYEETKTADKVTDNHKRAAYWYAEGIEEKRNIHYLTEDLSSTDAEIKAIIYDEEHEVLYAGGYKETGGVKVAGHWQIAGSDIATAANAQWHALSDGTNDAEITSLAVDGSDLYAGGYIDNPESERNELGYWKNSDWTKLADRRGIISSMVITYE